jgi:hypothetical protein
MAGTLKGRIKKGTRLHYLDGKPADPKGTTLELKLYNGQWVRGCYTWSGKKSTAPILLLHLASTEKGLLAEVELPESARLRWPKEA